MDRKSLVLTAYSHESFLPCELKEVVFHVKKKEMTSRNEKVGLKKDINVLPLNRGYLLHTKELVLVTNTLQPFYQINGKYTVNELGSTAEMESFLQQLHYYDLLSFGFNNGQLLVKDIPEKYRELYNKEGDFVTFPLVPITVELDLTNACNFACIHCSRDSKPKVKINSKEELSINDHERIIDECAQIGVLELLLMGGEPLYYPDFFKLVKYAKEKGIRDVRTSTNGWFIDNDTAEELSKYFDNIQVSVHGASSSTHDYIVGRKGSWEQAKRAVQTLKKYNLKVNVSFTVIRENVSEIHKMPYLVKEWGADSLRFIRLNRQGRGRLLKGWAEEEITQIGNEIKKIYENLPHGLELDAGGFPSLRPIRNDAYLYGCSAGKTLLSIAFDGRVRICGSLDEYVGNVREKSILDIWHSPELIKMRRQLGCHCNYRPICYGPCLVKP
jgi:radical SAM protein with 4Fe4S-binding SPASM domain